jgi:hypothetical protein
MPERLPRPPGLARAHLRLVMPASIVSDSDPPPPPATPAPPPPAQLEASVGGQILEAA